MLRINNNITPEIVVTLRTPSCSRDRRYSLSYSEAEELYDSLRYKKSNEWKDIEQIQTILEDIVGEEVKREDAVLYVLFPKDFISEMKDRTLADYFDNLDEEESEDDISDNSVWEDEELIDFEDEECPF